MTDSMPEYNNPAPTSNSNIPPSIIRTFVPIIVNGLLYFGLGVYIPAEELAALASAVVTIGYYGVVRALETYVSPNWGFLLGTRRAPAYGAVKTRKDAIDVQEVPQSDSDLTDGADVVDSSVTPQAGRADPAYNAEIGSDDAQLRVERKLGVKS